MTATCMDGESAMGVLLIDSAYMFVLFWMAPPIMSRGFFTKMWGYCGKYWRCLLSGRKDGPRTSTAYKNPVREVPAPLQPLEYTQNKSENKSKIVQNFSLRNRRYNSWRPVASADFGCLVFYVGNHGVRGAGFRFAYCGSCAFM